MSISLRRSFRRLSRQTLRQAFQHVRRSPLSTVALGLLLGGCTVPGWSQAEVVTPLQKQLQRVDFAINGVGLFNTQTSGTNYLKQPLVDNPGNTLGALVTLRYTVKPYLGFEGNYGYARYNQNYSSLGGVQANTNEYTLGYVAHPPYAIFGALPFVSVGAGSIGYKPTPGGGQGLLTQARAAYYYAVGADAMLTEHFGARVQFRQSISLAPDFGQNYLTIKQRTISSQPGFGFFYKF